MSHRKFVSTAIVIGSSATLLFGGVTGVANADPAPPLPIDGLQAPGLQAVQSLGPAIQKAAADPTNAASTLMAAAAVFAGNAAAPTDSRNVATAVNQFVAQPAAHVPAPGAVPGAEAHLPAGIDPAHAVGPMPEVATHARGGDHARTFTGSRPRCSTRTGGRSGSCARTGSRARSRPTTRAGGRTRRPGIRAGRPADAGLHLSVDQ